MDIAKRGSDIMILAGYIENMMLTSKNLEWIAEIKEKLRLPYDIKELEEVRQCLEIEFFKDKDRFRISQKKCAQEILKRFGMGNAKPCATPLDTSRKIKRPQFRS